MNDTFLLSGTHTNYRDLVPFIRRWGATRNPSTSEKVSQHDVALAGIKMDDFDLEHNEEQLPASDSATTVTVSLHRAARAPICVKLQQHIRTRESFEHDPDYDDDDEYYYDDPNLEEDVARIGM